MPTETKKKSQQRRERVLIGIGAFSSESVNYFPCLEESLFGGFRQGKEKRPAISEGKGQVPCRKIKQFEQSTLNTSGTIEKFCIALDEVFLSHVSTYV